MTALPGAAGLAAVFAAPPSWLTGALDGHAVAEALRAGAITPVPGGVGPMTIMTLMHNTLIAAHRRAGLSAPQMS